MRVRQVTLASLVVTALAMPALAMPAGAAPARADDDNRQRQIESSISRVRANLQETSRALVAAVEQLTRVETELAIARTAVAGVQARLRKARATEARLAAALAQSREQLLAAQRQSVEVATRTTQTHQVVDRIARTTYEQGPMSELTVYLGAQSPADLVDRVAYTRSALRDRDALLGRLDEQRRELSASGLALQHEQGKITELRTKAQANVVRMHRLEQATLVWQQRVEKFAARARGARAAIDREKKTELRRIAEMERESKALQSRLAARARRSGGWKGDTIPTLSPPASGYVSSAFGMRRHPITGVYKLHDGTDFGGACGSPVYAAASGFVLDSGRAGAWGNRLVIEHGIKRGRHVAASYNHLSRRLVSSGDYVYRGEVIGKIGDTGWSTGCHLHFSVYQNGKHVDPLRWL